MAKKFTPPYQCYAQVLRVYDGDTFTARLHPWPGVTLEQSVRVRGIDTPELRGKGVTPAEKAAARAARDFVRAWVRQHWVPGLSHDAAPGWVVLTDIGRDKYGGRCVATVSRGPTIPPLHLELIRAGHAVKYDGGRKAPWSEWQ